MNKKNLTGVIMCGGKSSRMGSDKGLLFKDGQSWAEYGYAKLTSVTIPVKLSINPSQRESYSRIFLKEILIEDELDIHGPLAGLLSIHSKLPQQDLLLLACDMTDIQISTIHYLIEWYESKKEIHDFFVFKNEKTIEPLLGIYTAKGLQKIFSLYKSGKLLKHSMKYILETGDAFFIPIDEKYKNEFKNYNSP